MEFKATELAGVTEIFPVSIQDDRGAFTRTFCRDAFSQAGLALPTAQMALSSNTKKHTLRGLHFIPEAIGEVKLVRCVRGAVFDVAVDMRPSSPTYGHWISAVLSEQNYKALYLPKGIAHGFLTLEDNSEVAYMFSEPYRPNIEKGVYWDDPALHINWPATPSVISDRDQSLPTLDRLDDIS